MNLTQSNSFGNVVFFVFLWNSQFLKSFIWHIQVKCLRTWERKIKVLKDSKIFGISGFSLRAVEPILKDGNNGKFRKPHSRSNLINGVIFSWVETCHLDEKFPKSSIWTKNCLVGNNKHELEQQFGKSSFLGFLRNSNS